MMAVVLQRGGREDKDDQLGLDQRLIVQQVSED